MVFGIRKIQPWAQNSIAFSQHCYLDNKNKALNDTNNLMLLIRPWWMLTDGGVVFSEKNKKKTNKFFQMLGNKTPLVGYLDLRQHNCVCMQMLAFNLTVSVSITETAFSIDQAMIY